MSERDEHLWRDAERLTAQMPVGTPVRYWTGLRGGFAQTGRIRNAFTVICASVVGWVDTHPAGIAATHIEPMEEATAARRARHIADWARGILEATIDKHETATIAAAEGGAGGAFHLTVDGRTYLFRCDEVTE